MMTHRATRNSLLAVSVVFALGIALPALRADDAQAGASELPAAPEAVTTQQDEQEQDDERFGKPEALAVLPAVG